MSDEIVKFPASRRKLSSKEEKEVRCAANLIHEIYKDKNPFLSDSHRLTQSEEVIREMLKYIFKINEE